MQWLPGYKADRKIIQRWQLEAATAQPKETEIKQHYPLKNLCNGYQDTKQIVRSFKDGSSKQRQPNQRRLRFHKDLDCDLEKFLKTCGKILFCSDVHPQMYRICIKFETSVSGTTMVSFRCTTMTRLKRNQFFIH